MKLIVGLGNPGAEHQQTRHNAGFCCVERVADYYHGNFKPQAKFHAETCQVNIDGSELWLVKPQTYMNHSGRAVAALMGFYKWDVQELLVIHDEIDLPPGTARLKAGGGHGGQNGLRDIINSLGSRDFMRLRIGVGHPGNKHQVIKHVLGRASIDDQQLIDAAIARAISCLPSVISGDAERAMNVLHTDQ